MSAGPISPYSLRRLTPTVEVDEPNFQALIDSGSSGPAIDLHQIWKTIRKHVGVLVAIPIVVTVVVGIREVMLPDLYTASSTILIRSSTPKLLGTDSEGPVQASLTGSDVTGDVDLFLNTKYELLQTSNLALKVIRAEDLGQDPAFTGIKRKPGLLSQLKHRLLGTAAKAGGRWTPPAEALVGGYLGALQVQPISGTQLVRITFTTRDPQLSARLANAHVRQFIQQGIDLNAQASEEAERFLQSKLSELKRKVEDSEAALNNYRRDKGIIPGLMSVNGKEDIILERLNKLSEELQEAHLKTITLGARMALIKQGRADALPAVVDDGIVQKLKDRLANLQDQYAGMAKDFKPNYPPMVALKAQISDTEAAIRTEEATVVSSIDAQYQEASKDEQNLEEELKKQKDFALGLNDAAVRYQILARDADSNRELYNSVLKRMKDVEVTGDLHASDISVVDQAQPPGGPSSPNRGRDVLMAAAVGLAGAVMVVFLLERLDNTLKDVEEVERYLGIPSLGVIPDFLSARDNNVYSLRAGGASAHRGERQLDYSKEIVLSYGSYSAAGEAYRMLRTAFVLSRAGAPPKTALVTSAVKGDGKTITAVNLAVMLAMTHKKVILVDADLRLPRCHDLFAFDNFFGLTEVLTGARELKEAVRATEIEGLDLLSSGEIPPNPSELLGSERMRAVLAQLEDLYDYVIIDSTPITQTSESTLLSTLVDGVIVVARSDSPKQQARAALSRLQQARAKVLGLVLNKTGGSSRDRYNYQYYSTDAKSFYGTSSESLSKTEFASASRHNRRNMTGSPGSDAGGKRAGKVSSLSRPTLTVAPVAQTNDQTEKASQPAASNGESLAALESGRDESYVSAACESPSVNDDHESDSIDMASAALDDLNQPAALATPDNQESAPPAGNEDTKPAQSESIFRDTVTDDSELKWTSSETNAKIQGLQTQEHLCATEGFSRTEPAPDPDPDLALVSNETTTVEVNGSSDFAPSPSVGNGADEAIADDGKVHSQTDSREPAEHDEGLYPEPADARSANESVAVEAACTGSAWLEEATNPPDGGDPSNWSSRLTLEDSVMPEEQIRSTQNTTHVDGMTRQPQRESDVSVFEISKESRFSGLLKFPGTVVVLGEVEGDLDASRVIVRESGAVTARVSADSVTIAGRVSGDVLARRELEILASGKLDGSASAPQMRLAPGAMLRGQCTIGG